MASAEDKHTVSKRNETFTLVSGQVIGYAQFGAPTGPVVFYFHGLPSSRLEAALWSNAASSAGVQLISIDRPGIGLSSVQLKRTLLDWPPIVSSLAEHLKIPEFYVLGVSAGGPYAIVCAKVLPKSQLQGVGVVSGMGPTSLGLEGMAFANKAAVKLTQWFPSLGVILYDWAVVPAAQDPDREVFYKQMTDGFKTLTKRDQKLLEDEETKVMLIEAAREHFRQGNKGLADEWAIFVGEWGFELESVTYDEIRLWCGTDDTMCPITMSLKMEERLGNAELTEFEGHTHYTVAIEKGEQIIRELLSDD